MHRAKTPFLLAVGLLVAGSLVATQSCRGTSPGQSDQIVLGERVATHGLDDDPIQVRRHRYRHGKAQGEVWIAEIDPRRAALTVEADGEQPRPLDELAKAATLRGDFVAINGSFYDERGPLDLVISHGRLIRPLRRDGGSGVFLLRDGLPRIVHRDDYRKSRQVRHALQSIDRLVGDGKIVVRSRPEMPNDARSLLAVDREDHMFLAVFYDQAAVQREESGLVYLNSDSSSTGPTLFDIAEFAKQPRAAGGLGADWALNLDGGLSTALLARIGGARIGVVGFGETINAVQAHVAPPPATAPAATSQPAGDQPPASQPTAQ